MKFVNIQESHLTKGIMILLFLLVFPIQVQAKDVTFRWEAVSEPVTGYKLYYKTGSDSQPPYIGIGLNPEGSPIMVGKVTSYTVTGLSADETYHFVLTAFNSSGESGFSSVVTIGPSDAPVIINITIQ